MVLTDRFREPRAAQAILEAIRARSTRPVRLMEFCGGHTHAILRLGIPALLPETIELRSGPGCPVCVTSATDLDHAIALARVPEVILTTFGDMVRVPGREGSLEARRADGVHGRRHGVAVRRPDARLGELSGAGQESVARGRYLL